jgi:hypothetical protein
MSKARLIGRGACCLLFVLGFVSQAQASPTAVTYSTGGLTDRFASDTFSLIGVPSGSITLDTVISTTVGINTAKFVVGDSGSFSGSEPVGLSYDLDLDGVTEILSQSATWTITPGGDSFVTVAASAPVLFVTSAGSWYVSLDAYSFGLKGIGSYTQPTMATFAPTPEPASMLLFGTGSLLMGGMFRAGARRKRRSSNPS